MSSIAYAVADLLPGAKLQATGNADRALCALTSAAASWCRGQELRGEATGLDVDTVSQLFDVGMAKLGVPDHRFERWVRGLNGTTLLNYARPFDIIREDGSVVRADPYQVTGISRLTVGGGVMAFDVGLGKTITAITAALCYTSTAGASTERLWIVCPLIAMGAWKPYLTFLRTQFREVQLLSVDSAHKAVAAQASLGGVLIIDEVHLLGDARARRTKACHALRPLFDVCIALTGTLLHAGIEKVLSMLDIAVPGGAHFANRWAAGEYFACLIRQRLGGRQVTSLAKPVGANKERFLAYISRLCVIVSRDQADVRACIDIPPQALHTVEVCTPFKPLHHETVALVEAVMAAGGTDAELPHASAIMHQLARANAPAKFDAWWDLARQDNEPWVLFAHYRDTLDALEAFLGQLGLAASLVRVDGDTKPVDRQLAQQRFQAGGVRFFVGQMTAAGQSIDLFRAHRSAAFDSAWKAVDYAQALGRTQRRGQTVACEHYDFIANVLQRDIVDRLREAQDFNAEAASYQAIRSAIAVTPVPTGARHAS